MKRKWCSWLCEAGWVRMARRWPNSYNLITLDSAINCGKLLDFESSGCLPHPALPRGVLEKYTKIVVREVFPECVNKAHVYFKR